MPSHLLKALGWTLAVYIGASPSFADEGPHGDLDFSRLSKPQEEFFWKRLQGLADEEAVVSYCGQADDFEQQAREGIRSCVTPEAIGRADAFFKSELKSAEASLRQRKPSCAGKPEATRGWLGVEIRPVSKDAADGAPVAGGAGALVDGALANSPAAAADLKAGDVITTMNGEKVVGPKELSARIRTLSPGATIELRVLRDGAERNVSVKLGAMAFDQDGSVALDMPAIVTSSKKDLKYVASEVTKMCQECKTTIWAVFCH